MLLLGVLTFLTLVPPEESGVTFVNHIEGSDSLNIFSYEYFYGGGGVALGDVNRDGRPDLYFTANMGPNKLYLNRGHRQFEDVTEEAGVAGPSGGWTTGVTMADANGDGFLDIYVCRSGDLPPEKRHNLLYVNNGDGTFSEKAAVYVGNGYAADDYLYINNGDGTFTDRIRQYLAHTSHFTMSGRGLQSGWKA